MICWTILLLLLADATVVPAAVKRWRHNTNFNNPDNWSLKRTPCPLDRVVFPSRNRHLAVLLPEGTTEVREMALPSAGMFILPSTGKIVIGERAVGRKTNCTRGDNVFLRTSLKAWLNPANWIPEDDDPSEATPHAERIPCPHDIAVFPDDSSFAVRLPQLPVYVGGIKFGSSMVSWGDWLEILRSEGGARFLVGPETLREEMVELTNRNCTDPAGCVCVQDQLMLMDIICSYGRTQCENDGKPPCYDPIIPHGYCCGLCGSYLELDFDRSVFSLAFLREHVQQFLQDEGVDDRVKFHVGRIGDERAQVVLVDRDTYTGDSVEYGDKLYSTLNHNMQLGVKAAHLVLAGSILQPDAVSRQIGLVFGTLMASVCILGGIFLVFVTCRDRLPVGLLDNRAFVFARFENVEGETGAVEVMARPTAPPRYDDVEDDNPSKAFDNPMYGKGKETASRKDGPVYSELKKREDEPQELLEIAEMKEVSPHTTPESEEELVEIDFEETLTPHDL